MKYFLVSIFVVLFLFVTFPLEVSGAISYYNPEITITNQWTGTINDIIDEAREPSAPDTSTSIDTMSNRNDIAEFGFPDIVEDNIENITLWLYVGTGSNSAFTFSLIHNSEILCSNSLTSNLLGWFGCTFFLDDLNEFSDLSVRLDNVNRPQGGGPTRIDVYAIYLEVDYLTPPNVTAVHPENDTILSYIDIEFEYSVFSESDLIECRLYLNGILNQTDDSPEINSSNTFDSLLFLGHYTWEVVCQNEFNLNGSSGINNFTIDIEEPFFTEHNIEPLTYLNPGSTKTILCNGTVNHENGFSSITEINGSIYHESFSINDQVNRTYIYHDSDCKTADTELNGWFECSFDVYFFAIPGNWSCSVKAVDDLDVSSSSNVTTYIEEMIALDVDFNQIDFGVQVPGTDTGINDFTSELFNQGNVALDFNVKVYDKEPDSNYAMNCTVGEIPVSNLRFDFEENVHVTSRVPMQSQGVDLGIKLDSQDSAFAVLPTILRIYWGAIIPNNVAGTCNGYIRYTAFKAE